MWKLIPCSNCGKMIEQKWVRTMCIKCRNLADHIRQEQIRQTAEFKEVAKIKRQAKKEGLI